MKETKVKIEKVNAFYTSQIYEKQADIEAEIEKIMQEKGLELFLFVVTDILENDSEVLAMGNAKGHVEQAFGEPLDNNRALLKGRSEERRVGKGGRSVWG